LRQAGPGGTLSDAAPSSRALVVATMMLGTVSTILSATIVNVAFPALIAEFHVGHDTLQWIAAGYLAAMTATMLGTAWLVETFGERTTFVGTLAIFLVASILAAASWNTASLIGARVLQGAAAGILQPLAMIVLFRVYPVNERGRAMGLYGFGIVLAPAVGPAIGGTLLEAFGWRSIFLLTVPFAVAGLVLGARTLATTRAAARMRFDSIGTGLLAASLVTLLNVPVVGHRHGFASAGTLALAAAAIAFAWGFVAWERRFTAPLLPMRLFDHRAFVGASIVAFAYGIGLFGSTYLVPVFAQEIAHYDAAEAGYLLAPAGIALAIAITAGGRLTDRLHPAPVVIAGLALFALSSLLLTFSGAATGFLILALWLVIGRVGLGMLIPALNVGAVQSLSGTELAYASAAVNFVRQLGGAIGVNLLAVVLEWRLGTVGKLDPARPFHECFAIVTLAFALAIVPAWLIRPQGGRHVSQDPRRVRRFARKPSRGR
jgi:MFS transporter, DHA2 family, multidrug resistance protein